ncbi:cytochrome c oxidase subunit II [Haloarchaeobius iranensis]|uniref:Cytochrome c oxidase subunit 2 n=1 Tax=Haloarchaeobius iranensis TaxID=996166 RepID=A0A1G9W2H8_9EURY|nr:cytochrome c oxidase subunit II [Haloarchaeobius iranensis]SDM78729.1 cytochrome c oxidase subunit 2 [Haloarchaeobius iranensis]
MQGGLLLQVAGQLEPDGTRAELFGRIFEVFLILGTVVGVVAVGYMLYNAYKYRDDGTTQVEETGDVGRPTLGELPEGGGHGRKLLLSFTLSAIIVISLILWTYWALLYVEAGAAQPAEPEMEDGTTVEVTGYQFGWEFEYPNGNTTDGTMYVPEGERVQIVVTSSDVMHNFGIPAFKTKTDAIPGQTTSTWFGPVEDGEYTIKCYELCGAGHSYMTGTVEVIDPAEYERMFVEPMNSTNSSDGGTERVAPATAAGGGSAPTVTLPTDGGATTTPAARTATTEGVLRP